MAELMLVNPRRRRRRKSATRRNPRRRRTMTPAQAKFFAPRRRRKAVRRNPRRRHRVAHAAPVRHHRRRRLRRNPRVARHGGLSLRSITSGGVLKTTVLPAAIGALGAVALDAAYAYLPIPANLKTGQFSAPVKAAAVIGLGALGSRFLPRQSGMIRSAVSASLTIMAYNYIKAHVQAMLPNVQLGAYIDGMGYVQAGQFIPDNSGMGAYIDGMGGGSTGVAWSNIGDTIGDEVF